MVEYTHWLVIDSHWVKLFLSVVIINSYFLKIYLKMNKMPHLEINCIPSQLNTSPITGVASQLASVAENAPQYDGVTIGQMRNNPLYQRIDDIDKIGLSKDQMLKTAQTVKSNLKKIRAVNELGSRMRKPSNLK